MIGREQQATIPVGRRDAKVGDRASCGLRNRLDGCRHRAVSATSQCTHNHERHGSDHRVQSSQPDRPHCRSAALPRHTRHRFTSGLGDTWGLLRYWWVFIKLVLSLLMTVLVFVLLLPGIHALPEVTNSLTVDAVRERLGPAGIQWMFPPVVSFAMLAAATVLSIFKPRAVTPWSKHSYGGLKPNVAYLRQIPGNGDNVFGV